MKTLLKSCIWLIQVHYLSKMWDLLTTNFWTVVYIVINLFLILFIAIYFFIHLTLIYIFVIFFKLLNIFVQFELLKRTIQMNYYLKRNCPDCVLLSIFLRCSWIIASIMPPFRKSVLTVGQWLCLLGNSTSSMCF